MTPTSRPATWTRADVEAFLPERVEPVRAGFLYRAGLLAVAVSLILLQAIYLAMVALAGWATWLYMRALPGIVGEMHVNFISIIAIATPAVTGVVVTFFLFKPLLTRAPTAAEMVHLDREAEPVLFAFVERLCRALGAPVPRRIDVDLRVNASAGLRRGWFSLFSRDLVLTVGLPLAAGMDVRQFGGVLAHEFGHFSQHAGMRLYFLIGVIRRWFTRVAYERDKWDAHLERLRKTSGWRMKTPVNVAWATVEVSRYILRGLLYCANAVSAWFSRQMEFDADQHAAALAGADAFGEALGLLPVLDLSANGAWQTINRAWKSQKLCDDFAMLVRHRVSGISEDLRKQIASGDPEEAADRWSTHPPRGQRIARIQGLNGVLGAADAPAESLFSDFEGLCRRTTRYFYGLSLGEAAEKASLQPVEYFVEETALETRRAEALEENFGPVTMPARWFRLPQGPRPDGPLQVYMSLADESTRYWSVLEESLHRFAALEFIRLGGKVKPEGFQLSSSDPKTVEVEEQSSREALQGEISRLRVRFLSRGYFFSSVPAEWISAYETYSAGQDDLLELRYRLVAMRIVLANAKLLPIDSATDGRNKHLRRVREGCDAVIRRFARCDCPALGPGDAEGTLADRLLVPEGWETDVETAAAHILDSADRIGSALLGEICWLSGAPRAQAEP
jgi:Zn-dependent protease with chaperone function